MFAANTKFENFLPLDQETLPENAAVVVHKDSTGIGVAYVKMELDEDF